MEKIIEEKLKKQQTSDYCDAFDYMLSSAKEDDYELTMQELKVNHRRPNPNVLCTLKNIGSLLHQWFHKEPLPSMEPFHSTKGYLEWKRII